MKTAKTTATPAASVQVVWIDSREAADYLGLSVPTLSAMRRNGTGPAFCRVSPRRVVYSVAALNEYMDARIVNPAKTA